MSAWPGAATRAARGRLARLHLRTGLLRLARVELEELAGEVGLDTDGILDLAEARWRTGDLRGAAEAAGAWLEAGAGAAGVAARDDAEVDGAGDEADGRAADGRARALAHALIADGLTVRGRHDDAAVHVAAALDALPAGTGGSVGSIGSAGSAGSAATPASLGSALDALFAGISPRADAWPSFGLGDASPGPVGAAANGVPATRLFSVSTDPATPDPIAAADERLGAGDDAAAAVLLVLALRAAPSRAGEVLERADAALAARPGAVLLLARAEALRALGRHEAAGIAYAVADAHARGAAAAPSSAPGALDPINVRGIYPDAAGAAAAPDAADRATSADAAGALEPETTDPRPEGSPR